MEEEDDDAALTVLEAAEQKEKDERLFKHGRSGLLGREGKQDFKTILMENDDEFRKQRL